MGRDDWAFAVTARSPSSYRLCGPMDASAGEFAISAEMPPGLGHCPTAMREYPTDQLAKPAYAVSWVVRAAPLIRTGAGKCLLLLIGAP